MEPQLSNRRTVAAVLVTLIRQRLVAARSNTILRTSLHASVPVSERAGVRRGLDALVDHGVLAQSGEAIGFTAKGRVYLAHTMRGPRTTPAESDPESESVLAALMSEIDHDERFDPYRDVEAVESLPARLEAELAPKKPSHGLLWVVLAFLLVAATLVYALKN